MREDPEREEDAADEFAPLGDGAVDLARGANGNGNGVREYDGDGRDHESAPFHHVQICELVALLIRTGFGREREGDIHASDDFEKALEYSCQMRARAANDPELLVSPPFL